MARSARSLFSVLAAVLAVPLLLAGAAGGAPQEPTPDEQGWTDLESFGEEISVEVASLQVWVTDRDGNPVTGLEKEDFELYEDGELVPISNFTAYEGSGGRGSSGEAAPSGVAPETRLEVAEEPERIEPAPEERLHLALLVDNRTIRPSDRARVFQDLRELLAENLVGGDRVAVAVHDRGLQLVQRFTEEPVEVVGALGRVEKLASRGTQLESERRSALREIEEAMREAESVQAALARGPGEAANQPSTDCRVAIGDLQGTAQRYAAAVQGHVQSSAGAIATLSQVLSGVPGRRVILYVGSGLAQTPGILLFEHIGELCPNERSQLTGFQTDYDMTWLYEEVAARANAAGVTLYTLEAPSPAVDLGLDSAAGGSDSGSGRSYRPSTHLMRVEDQDMESSLVLMARQTGGRSFLNASDLSGDLNRIVEDARSYYSLGFAPPDPGDGQLHRLEVELKDGKGYRVRHRLRYRDKPAEEQLAERVRAVAQLGTGSNPLAVRVEIGEPFPAGEEGFRVPTRLWIPFETLTLLEVDGGGLRGQVRVLLATTDARGELQPVRQKVVPVRLPGAEEPPPGGEHLVEVQLTLPAGDHHVALGVRDDLGGETSYLRERFRLPSSVVAEGDGGR